MTVTCSIEYMVRLEAERDRYREALVWIASREPLTFRETFYIDRAIAVLEETEAASVEAPPECCGHPFEQHHWAAAWRGFVCAADGCACAGLDPEEA